MTEIPAPILSLRGIGKAYGPVVAVREVAGFPQVTHAWSAGRLAYVATYPD